INSISRFFERSGLRGFGQWLSPVELFFNSIHVTRGQQRKDNSNRQSATRAAALEEFAINPGGERHDDEKDSQPPGTFSIVQGNEAQQPDGGREHRKSHGDLEL